MWKEKIEKPVFIGKHVWIGAGVIILPGIKIGDFSVIGSGSVVTAHVPKGSIVAGNPARVIKYRNIKKLNDNDSFNDDYLKNKVTQSTFLSDDKICKKKIDKININTKQ